MSTPADPRFRFKFNNGYWRVFDTISYSDICTESLKRDAASHAARLNTTEPEKASTSR